MPHLAPVQQFLTPENLDSCLEIIEREGEAALVIAGGQAIMPILKTRGLRPSSLVDLSRVAELKAREVSPDGWLTVGAMTRHREIWGDGEIRGRWSALADAASNIGDRQVQNRGTIGGNIVFGSVITDMKQVVMCLDAEMHVAGPNGIRVLRALEQFANPANEFLRGGELLVHLRFPPACERSGSAYVKYGITVQGRPVIGVAAWMALGADKRCIDARIVVGGLSPCPQVAGFSARMLVGKEPGDEEIGAAANGAAEEVRPQSDGRASAGYRRQLIRSYARKALQIARDRALEDG